MNPAPGGPAASQPSPSKSLPATSARWWQRLHASLMPDYNRQATLYWWLVVMLGAGTLVYAVLAVSSLEQSAWLQVAGGALMALLAGFFPLRIPRSKNSFAAGEVFIFLLLLIHGPAAAALAAAAEALVGACRTSKRWTSRIASPAIAGLAMFVAGSLLHHSRAYLPDNPGVLIVATMLFAMVHFGLNTLLVTALPRLKRDERLQWSDLMGLFGWVAIVYAGSATVASLLYLTYQQNGAAVLMAMVPLLTMMLATLHYFFRQQEAAEAVREINAEAAEREREVAARHVAELQASERRFHSAFTHASIGMALLAFDGRILQANPGLRLLLGWPGDALLAQHFQDQAEDQDRAALAEHMAAVSNPGFEGFALDLRCRHSSGGSVWVTLHCSHFSEPGASAPCLILQVQDITARRKAETGLHHIAFHDSLTGLPNRRRFHELLGHAVIRALEEPDAAFAVMFLDFDRFKLINDSLGHSAGDQFLIQVSKRIGDSLRPGDLVARLGGDEFAVLATDLQNEQGAMQLAERLLEALRRPFLVAQTELMTSASIGITFSGLGYTNSEDVLRDADTAMYKAKAAGKARYALFDASLHTEVANRLRLEGDLRRALAEGQLGVAYQPIFQMHSSTAAGPGSGLVIGFEALARWDHPLDGPISAERFLPIAEEAGLLITLTDYVLHRACRQLREWHQLAPNWAGLKVHVNVTSHDVAHAAFIGRVTRAFVDAGLLAQHLCVEITENVLSLRLESASPVLAELRRLGVQLAIDGFGAGYSSLSRLSSLPIDCLKIDRSFVAGLQAAGHDGDSSGAAVLRSIVLLGTALGKVVVAEGVETALQIEQLRAVGCRFGQGFGLARPLPAQDVPAFLMGQPPIGWPQAGLPQAALPNGVSSHPEPVVS